MILLRLPPNVSFPSRFPFPIILIINFQQLFVMNLSIFLPDLLNNNPHNLPIAPIHYFQITLTRNRNNISLFVLI
jgi:hypothetical protein